MIHRQHGRIIIECESCDATYEGDKETEFEVLWNTAKSEGWKARQIAGEWLHSCPKCRAPT